MNFYGDTSVWGGHEDKEFEQWTMLFLSKQGKGNSLLFDGLNIA